MKLYIQLIKEILRMSEKKSEFQKLMIVITMFEIHQIKSGEKT